VQKDTHQMSKFSVMSSLCSRQVKSTA